MNGYIEIRLIF